MVLLTISSMLTTCFRVVDKDTFFHSFLVTNSMASPSPYVTNNTFILTFHILKSFFPLNFSRSILGVPYLDLVSKSSSDAN